jgi:glycerol-3-phosphate dehydrogenase
VNLVIDRPPPPVAIGIRSRWGIDRDPIMGGRRFLFMTSWKGMTLAGTSYRFATGSSPSRPAQIRDLVDEWNAASPGLDWNLSDVTHHHCGRLPLREGHQGGRPTALLDQGLVIDHRPSGLDRFFSVVGTKFTTARHLAEETVDAVLRASGRKPGRCLTSEVPLGTDPTAGADPVVRARHAIRDEMAQNLEDLVVRRLGLGLTRCPPVDVIGRVADAAALEWGWNARQTDDEIAALLGRLLPGGATRAA